MQQGAQPRRAAAAPARAPQNPSQNTGGPSHSINSMVAGAVWWIANKYSGAFLSWASRFLYSIYCNWLIGGATGFWGNVKWFVVCMKAEEDISNYAYSNSQQILSILTAGGAYWLSHRLQRFWYRTSTIAQAGADIIQHELGRRLDSIQGHLEQMAQEREELRASFQAASPQASPVRVSRDSSPPLVSRRSSSPPAPQSGGGYNLRKSSTGRGKK
ncbi:MAG: hypothetical protein JSR17_09775 [Proteobacteria bacterium]|nr:hypothetical protein [Pseudomonadota bacterium]